MMRKEYRGKGKCQVGPGGIKCSCCGPMGVSPRKSKPLMRRVVRRTNKQKMEKEDENC